MKGVTVVTDMKGRFENYLAVMIAGRHETINGIFTETDLKAIINDLGEARSVTTLIEHVVEEMCDKYCKYPEQWDEEAEGVELSESDICKNCPLNRLV